MRISYRKLFFLVIYCMLVIWTMLTGFGFIGEERAFQSFGQNETSPLKQTIHITTVVCSISGQTAPREEGAILIKSVIVSAMLNKINESFKFHLFLEHMERDSVFFSNKLREFGYPFKDFEVELLFYSVEHYMPKEYKYLLYNTFMLRCTYAKLYLPTALSQLDAVIYLDTDFIITGNVAKIWAQFDEMDEHQAIGMAPDSEPESPHKSDQFKKLPYPPPKGLNGGLVLMNLTRIRSKEVKWQERVKMLDAKFKTEKLNRLNDQQLLNVFLYYYSNLLKVVPCQFNFFFVHCNYGLHCKAAEEDPYGIQALHGAFYNFEEIRESRKHKDGSFRGIYVAYKNINLTSANLDLKRDLMKPIRLMLTLPKGVNASEERYMYRCIGTIDKLLYKNYFVQNDSTADLINR